MTGVGRQVDRAQARQAGDAADAHGSPAPARPGHVREVVTVVVLSVTAVLTAWSVFEASQWGGEMSIAFSKASSARIEASRHAAEADAARGYDLQTFAVWVQAVAQGDEPLAAFARERFSPQLAPAMDAWLATEPLQDPDAPRSPFALPVYEPPGAADAAEADARAEDWFARALLLDERSDRYTFLTVLFALVLFFASLSTRGRAERLRWTLLGVALVLVVVGTGLLLAFPKIV
ncbi:hypothetical protein Celf_0637 [Cellulomonas fimi ATCC 484]|uniref:Uncharacterized protein n=2 Tax=Cellulomonas fimi TaxID=1708 RepID=F4GYQ8_CELFA|nr:hypothetical protein Celf_0637 [Cellulomonas fimi ATCC 484]VEH27268.1 Uncharacterised protein [Cellulomonas fimi]